jgi:hypothetical protein
MTHVNLDTQPEVVRQFVLELSTSPEGVVLESAGRPVACVVPAPAGNGGSTAAGEWTDEKNRRRYELLDRKYDRGLSPAEHAELTLLQHAMHRYIDQVAPLPLDAARIDHRRADLAEPDATHGRGACSSNGPAEGEERTEAVLQPITNLRLNGSLDGTRHEFRDFLLRIAAPAIISHRCAFFQ